MKRRQVTYSATAEDDLDSIFAVVARKASPATALGFTERIDSFCRSLDCASERGTRLDDVRAGLRSVGFEGRVTVVFHVTEDAILRAGEFGPNPSVFGPEFVEGARIPSGRTVQSELISL